MLLLLTKHARPDHLTFLSTSISLFQEKLDFLSLSCSHVFWIEFMKYLQDFVERQKWIIQAISQIVGTALSTNHPVIKKSDMPTNQMDLKRYLFDFLPNWQDHIVEKNTTKKMNFRCSTVQQLIFPRRLAITWIVKSHGWIKKDFCVIFCLFDEIIS